MPFAQCFRHIFVIPHRANTVLEVLVLALKSQSPFMAQGPKLLNQITIMHHIVRLGPQFDPREKSFCGCEGSSELVPLDKPAVQELFLELLTSQQLPSTQE